MAYRRRRITFVTVLCVMVGAFVAYMSAQGVKPTPDNNTTISQSQAKKPTTIPQQNPTGPALIALDKLAVKGRAPKTGYSRDQFGDGWADTGGCNVRERILARDMTEVRFVSDEDCRVLSGTLNDPYTGRTLSFARGPGTSSAVQIDHVVAISNAWQTGAQQLTPERREELSNDPLELLAVDGPANNNKGDGDAATWLPPNKDYRCRYIARQIAVKLKYGLWVTEAEHKAMRGVLESCPSQVLPVQH